MTPHQIMVLYTGAIYCVIGLTIFVAWKVLGPRYADHWTIDWRLRGVIFAAAVAAIVQGLVILFPGRLVRPECMSPVRPMWATILFAAILGCTETIVSMRAPPPIMLRVQRLFAVFRAPDDRKLVEAAMILPAAAIGEPPPIDPALVRFASPRLRRWIMVGSIAGLLIIFVLVLHAAGSPLPPR